MPHFELTHFCIDFTLQKQRCLTSPSLYLFFTVDGSQPAGLSRVALGLSLTPHSSTCSALSWDLAEVVPIKHN